MVFYFWIFLNLYLKNQKAFQFYQIQKIWFFNYINAINKAATDPNIKGIVIKIDRLCIGFAQIQELRRTIKNFKKTGKPVLAWIKEFWNSAYYLASCADTVLVAPTNTVNITGFSSTQLFFKNFLEMIGIKFEYSRRGQYKTALHSVTEDSFTDAHKESLTSLLESMHKQLFGDIAIDRKNEL